MAKKSALEKINETVLPEIDQVTAPVVGGEVSNISLRRQKVRELHRQGFDVKRISMILEQGIGVKDGVTITVPCSTDTIKQDIAYIEQESLSEDKEFLVKRAEILDKLQYLYNQTIIQSINSKNPAVKNSFINTAIAILGKITDIEGVASPHRLDIAASSESRSFSIAKEIKSLSKEDQDAIISTITDVLKGAGELQKPAGSLLLRETPRVPASSGDDAGVSGES